MKPSELTETIEREGVDTLDLLYSDGSSAWRAVCVPAATARGATFANTVTAGTVGLRPDFATARVDRSTAPPRVSLVCDVVDPATGAPSDVDPRRIARRAEERLRSSGVADAALLRVEVDFHLPPHTSDPAARQIRAELLRSGDALEFVSDHGAGRTTAGLRPLSPLRAADAVLAFKRAAVHVASFAPKPYADGPGAGLRVGLTLSSGGRPIFFDRNGFAECSQTMLHAIGGILTHARSLAAFAAPTYASYGRLHRHGGAPVDIGFSTGNPSTVVGISALPPGDAAAKRLEYRVADPSADPYVCFAALVAAVLNGVDCAIDPVRAGFGPLEHPIPATPGDRANRKKIPATLREALDALADDRGYLTESGIVPEGFVDRYLALRTVQELAIYEPFPLGATGPRAG